ncbi:MAG: hypothetical protein U1E50_13475 [Caulobacteraceae bacterium]
MSARRLRLSPEWQCWPLWDVDNGHNIDPADLDIPAALRVRIEVWDQVFQDLYDDADPTAGLFESEAVRARFAAEGEAIARELERALDCGPIPLTV